VISRGRSALHTKGRVKESRKGKKKEAGVVHMEKGMVKTTHFAPFLETVEMKDRRRTMEGSTRYRRQHPA